MRKSRTTNFFFYHKFAVTMMWQNVNGREKIMASCENDRQLFIVCYVKIVAKKVVILELLKISRPLKVLFNYKNNESRVEFIQWKINTRI